MGDNTRRAISSVRSARNDRRPHPTAIELLDAIIAAARDKGAAADTLIARYFAARRYAGSRTAARCTTLVLMPRHRRSRWGSAPASGRAALVAMARTDAALAATFDGHGHGRHAEFMSVSGGGDCAAADISLTRGWWQTALMRTSTQALVGRAPLDVRVNGLREGPLPPGEAIPGLRTGCGSSRHRPLPYPQAVERSPAARR
ncbi:hypothetical protein AB5I41_05640 [Sphingomonas sp. MMS24-JH45]